MHWHDIYDPLGKNIFTHVISTEGFKF